MVVDACIKNSFVNDSDDDDEGPIFFKRTKTASSRNQLSAEAKKTPLQNNDVAVRKQASSDVRSPNGQSSNLQKAKVGSSVKTPPVKTVGMNSKESTSSVDKSKQSLGKSLGNNDMEKKGVDRPPVERNNDMEKKRVDKPPVERNNDMERKRVDKPPVERNNDLERKRMDKPPGERSSDIERKRMEKPPVEQNNDMEKKRVDKAPVEPKAESEDSDDDKPLSFRLHVASPAPAKNNSGNVSKTPTSSAPSSSVKTKDSGKNASEDSEDELPLSSKYQYKPAKKCYESDEDKKPIISKSQQNGSVKRDNEPMKSQSISNKRPLSDTSNSVPSSAKKLKPSNASASASKEVRQTSVKAEPKTENEDDDDDVPIAQRMKRPPAPDSKSPPIKKTPAKGVSSSSAKGVSSSSAKGVSSSSKKINKKSKKIMKKAKYSQSTKVPPNSGEGQKWTTLEHCGVIFPPPYNPHGVKMLYNGQPVDLTPEQEEVATMFAVMKDTDYATKPKFLENFWNDWKLILGKNHVIKKFELCDFTPIYEWHQREKEKKKQMTTEEKKLLKEEKLKQEEKYMWAVVDGVREKVGNFRVEPPGLFRGRGEHPKMGKLKKRIRPKDITINIGADAPIPECPIPGERWKEVKHDNTVTWLAFWNDPINPKEFKYVFLAASSSLKGQSDKEKYEKARLLKDYIHNIRANYTKDFVNKDIMKRQIAVATYLIDKLALRAGNEKDDDEADTVGCCTLKVENVTLVPPNQLQFDFLGKDSIRYFNTVEVEVRVYEAIGQFKSGKKEGDDLFDKLDTSKLNAHLKELMPGLTAKVFRTYNASITLDDMLNRETKGGDVPQKIVVYQHANKEVAIICNHQRTVSKSHSAQMSKLSEKMEELKAVLDGLKTDLARAKKGKPPLKDADGKTKKNLSPEVLEKKIAQTNVKIEKMERDMKTKEDLKTVALGTSKINYLDPRISVAWCKRHEVPIEKIFNKSLLAKFAWAMDVDPDFRF